MTTKPPQLDDAQRPPFAFEALSSAVARAIRTGSLVRDRVFDRFLSLELRVVSDQHWTPVSVAIRAAQWLDELGVRTVVDIGSGAGKFCVVAALARRQPGLFIGIEQRARLVLAARSLARTFEVGDRVRFVEATFGRMAVPDADAYYFFNSFGENLLDPGERLDEDVELGAERHERDVASARALMRHAPGGTYILTYNGFGGQFPAGYQRLCVDRETPSVLSVYRKAW